MGTRRPGRNIAQPGEGGLLGMGQTVHWKPVIAAVHGYVLGAGFGLAMASDIIVAAEGTQFQIREVQRGIAGAQHWATTWFWGGGRFATEIALTGRYFSAEEAHQLGIVNRVTPPDGFLPEAFHVRRGDCFDLLNLPVLQRGELLGDDAQVARFGPTLSLGLEWLRRGVRLLRRLGCLQICPLKPVAQSAALSLGLEKPELEFRVGRTRRKRL